MDPTAIRTYAILEDSPWWFLGRREIIDCLIEARLAGPMRILDWGSGTGGNFRMLSRFSRVTSVDASDLSLELCRARGMSDVIKAGTLQEFPVQDQYNLVTNFDVLEHIADD